MGFPDVRDAVLRHILRGLFFCFLELGFERIKKDFRCNDVTKPTRHYI
jgi:hypothetical protein